jgi:adenine-specific DNA-methyltransferase
MKWNKVICGDGIKQLKKLPDASVDLVFTSPPDVSETSYKTNVEKYKKFQASFCDEFCRITKPDGFIVICQTDRKKGGEIISNHITYHNQIKKNNWKLKDHKIVVRNSIESKDQFRFNYQNCLIFTQTGKIARKGEFRRNILVYQTKIHSVPGVSFNLFAWNPDFVELMIASLTKEKDKVLDCFAGSGVVPRTAKKMNRQYLGVEINQDMWRQING